MYVIHYHNEHTFSNPGDCEIYGPYASLDEAKQGLARLVATVNDQQFRVKPESDGMYAGYDFDELHYANRDTDLESEVWAEIVPLKPAL